MLILLYIILLLLIFFGLPQSIIYSHDPLLGWVPFVLLFIVQWVFIYGIAISFSLKPYTAKGMAALTILISCPLYGIYLGRQQNNRLSKNGKIAIGVVFKKWQDTGNGKNEWLLRCHFEAYWRTYSTFSETDRDNIYHVGDSLHVLYSKDDPNDCVILELKNK